MPESAVRIEIPSLCWQESYRQLICEFQQAGEPLIPFPLRFPNDDFPAFLMQLEAATRGEGIPAGFVPHSTYWAIADDQVVGVVNLRHSLTDSLRRDGGQIGYGVRPSARRQGYSRAMLKFALERVWELGHSQALLTCSKCNVASARTMIGCGGRLVSEEYLPDRSEVIQRYEIPTNPVDSSGSRDSKP